MRELATLDFHPHSEKVTDVLVNTTRNPDRQFFRILIAYYLGKIAASMRVSVKTKTRSNIPVNVYAINLAPSGYGKGHSTNVMEEIVTKGFRDQFMNETFDEVAEVELARLANQRAARKSSDENDEMTKVNAEFDSLGEIAFSFDSGSTPAMKQMRYKLLMANAGAINLEIDEIGSNLLGNVEILNSMLELYDKGKIKQKLTKNTAENVRGKDLDGSTPTNAMLYGTPSKLFDGARVEEEFYSMLNAGYARRCIFGFARNSTRNTELTPEEIYDMSTAVEDDGFLEMYASHLASLADPSYFNRTLSMRREVELVLLEYTLHCEGIADSLSAYDDLRRTEITHRYFRALKIAGAYAFVDGSHEVTEDHLYYAIALVEESGKAFEELLARDPTYVKLAKYLSEIKREVTHADLMAELPFYKGTNAQRSELLTLATAWGYRNNIIIKKTFVDGIEFLAGESLQETNLDEMIVSWSSDIAVNYTNLKVPFSKLDSVGKTAGMHWVNHHLYDGHRQEGSIEAGFNMVVLDVDDGFPMAAAIDLLEDYKYIMYTTKRHTAEFNRYRIILPTNYTLKLDAEDFKEFMHNLYEFLPFKVDTATGQRARKWLTADGDCITHDGVLLDVLPFIPKTRKNEQRKEEILGSKSLTNLERWFIQRTGNGNRSNQLVKYAYMLIDAGLPIEQVRERVVDLNKKLPDKLTEAEILSTIMVSATKAFAQRQAA